MYRFLTGTLVLLFGTALSVAQTGCKYDGDYSRILSAVKAKNTRTDRHKLTDGHVENIAKYWVADCKCREGVDTMNEARKLANEAFTTKSHFTDTFIDKGTIVEKDMSGFGDLAPPFVPFTASSCLKGSGGPINMTIEGATDCAPEASRIPELDGQLGAYASQFFIAYCQCKAGVPDQATADRLIATMKINHKSFNDFKNSATGALSTRPLTTCNVDPGAGGANLGGPKPISKQNFGEIMTSNQLSRDLTGFMGALASESDSPGLKALADEMQRNTQSIDQIRADASVFGPLDQSSNDMLDVAENVMQAVAIGKAIFGVNKDKKPELTPGQKEIRSSMGELSRKVRLIYDEVRAIPYYYECGDNTLEELDRLELRLKEYEAATANARLLYLEYIVFDGFPTQSQMNQLRTNIEGSSLESVLERIAEIQRQYNTGNMPHMTNANVGLAGTADKINYYRARCYDAMGMEDKAQAIRAKLNYNVDINDAIKLTQEAFRDNDFYSASRYAEIIQNYFQDEKTVRIMYPDLISLSYDFEGINRFEINYLIALGVISYVKTDQATHAKQALKALTDMHEGYVWAYENYRDNVSNRKKAFGMTNEGFRLETMRSQAMLNVAKAKVESKWGSKAEALNYIEEALELYKEAPELGIQKFELWLMYQELELLVNLEAYDQAKMALRELKTKERIPIPNSVYKKGNLGFLNAYIRFKTGDLKGAEFALKILKKKNANSPRVYALEEQVYLAMGETEKAAVSKEKYLEVLQNQ